MAQVSESVSISTVVNFNMANTVINIENSAIDMANSKPIVNFDKNYKNFKIIENTSKINTSRNTSQSTVDISQVDIVDCNVKEVSLASPEVSDP